MLHKIYPNFIFQSYSVGSIVITFVVYFILCAGFNSGLTYIWKFLSLPLTGSSATILLGMKWIVTCYLIGAIVLILLSRFHVIKSK